MKIQTLAAAIGNIDDDLITAADEYIPECKNTGRSKIIKYSVCAAGVCAAMLLGVLIALRHLPRQANENELCTVLSVEEALEDEIFGEYFPLIYADGYSLENAEVYIYGSAASDVTVMEAYFYKGSDEIYMKIEPLSLYEEYYDTDIIYYRTESSNPDSSFIYVDCGDYIVYYSSAADLNEVDGFYEMITSSLYFNK